jgi:hypothetical protein
MKVENREAEIHYNPESVFPASGVSFQGQPIILGVIYVGIFKNRIFETR